MPLAEDMSVTFAIATKANLMGLLTHKGKEGSRSRGSMEK